MSATHYPEMRLVECPGCGDPLESRHWDDLTAYDSESYDCDCGVGFTVTWVDGTGFVVEQYGYE